MRRHAPVEATFEAGFLELECDEIGGHAEYDYGQCVGKPTPSARPSTGNSFHHRIVLILSTLQDMQTASQAFWLIPAAITIVSFTTAMSRSGAEYAEYDQ